MKSREISRSKIGPFSLAGTDPYIGIGWEYQSIFFAVSTFDHLVWHLAVFFAKTTLGPGFVSMSQARINRIARLVPFDELKRRNLSELLRLPSFLMLVKQCEDPSANTLLPIVQSKFRSAESEPFAHLQRIKPRTTTTGNMKGSFLTWNLAIFFCPIPTKPATVLTPNSRDWWTKVTGKGPYLQMSFQSQGSDSVFAKEHSSSSYPF